MGRFRKSSWLACGRRQTRPSPGIFALAWAIYNTVGFNDCGECAFHIVKAMQPLEKEARKQMEWAEHLKLAEKNCHAKPEYQTICQANQTTRKIVSEIDSTVRITINFCDMLFGVGRLTI